MLRFHGVVVDFAQIAHQFAGARIHIPQMLRCAKDLRLKARLMSTDWLGLQQLQLPATAECQDNTFVFVGKVTGGVNLGSRSGSSDEPIHIVGSAFWPQIRALSGFQFPTVTGYR